MKRDSTTTPPELIRTFAARAGSVDSTTSQVQIAQHGEMWLKPGQRGIAFTATQLLAVDRVAFSWQARFPLIDGVALTVIDDYDHGDGGLAVRLLGLPLKRERGQETSEGEALRYLAELAFVPPAISANSQLEWQDLGDRQVEVATRLGGRRLAVTLEFDHAGDIERASSQMRQRKVDGNWQPTPWGGEFGSYETVGNLRLPTAAEAHWDLPAGRYVYWRANVTAAELLERPFRLAAA